MTEEQINLEAAKIAAGFFEGRHIPPMLDNTAERKDLMSDMKAAVKFAKVLLEISGVKSKPSGKVVVRATDTK